MGVAFVVVVVAVVGDEAVVAAFCAGQKCSPAQPHVIMVSWQYKS